MGARLPTTLEPRNRWSSAAILVRLAMAAIAVSGAAAAAASSTYEEFHREFSAQRHDAAQVARVRGLVLTRDAGRFPSAPRGVVFNDLESVLCEVEKAKW